MNEALKAGLVVPLMEEFYTIQGEGYHKGSAAYFVRIGGCDVGCHWCDVKESWDAEKHPPTEISTIINNAKQYSDTIVVTGGEPLMWNMSPLQLVCETKIWQLTSKPQVLILFRAIGIGFAFLQKKRMLAPRRYL